MSYKYLAEAIFFLGVVIGLIKWIGRTFAELSGPKTSRESENMFLARVMQEHGARTGASAGTIASSPSASRVTTAAIVVHCPACGAALNRVANSLPFAADCDACGRHVSVRGDGPGRLSVVVTDANR